MNGRSQADDLSISCNSADLNEMLLGVVGKCSILYRELIGRCSILYRELIGKCSILCRELIGVNLFLFKVVYLY